MPKLNLLYSLFIMCIFLSCDEPETIVSNTISPDYDYQLNLTRTDSGVNKYSASISWNSYNEDDFSEYQITVDDETTSISDSTVSTYTLNLNPGEFKQVVFKIITTDEQEIYQESIQVFTRIIEPIVWDKIEVGEFTELTFSPSTEPVDEFQKYIIYRTISPIFTIEILNPLNCVANEICMELITLTMQQTTSYIDESATNRGYCYVMATFDHNESFQSSTIISGEFGIAVGPSSTSISTFNVSNTLVNYIELVWTNSMEDTSFYKIDIWRGNSEDDYTYTEVNDITFMMPSALNTKLATITEFNVTRFEDRNNIGSGTTFYYLIQFTNIHDKSISNGEPEDGITYP